MSERPGGRDPLAWFDDPMTRRTVFGLLGLTVISTACSSGAASTATSTTAAAPTTTIAPTATTAAATVPSAATSAAADTVPPTTAAAAPTTTTATTEGTTTTTATTEATTTTASVPVTAPAVVLGSNANITDAILTSDSESYSGAWTAVWAFDDHSGSGTITANIVIDPTTRTVIATGTISGPLLAAPIPTIIVNVPIDSYVYDNDGNFQIHYPTSLGATTISSDGGFGKFTLHVDLAGRAVAVAIDATGVANRPSLIPITFTITAADGSTKPGTVQGKPG